MEKKKILVVDADPDVQRSLAITLKRAGYDVSAAGDGRTALDLLRNPPNSARRFDLVITDLRTPGLSGLRLIDAILRQGISVAIGVCTAYNDRGLFAVLRHRGCAFCLGKPFSAADLLTCVSEALAAGSIAQRWETESGHG